MTRKETLHNAEICVCGQREQDYGSPEDNFGKIAELWTLWANWCCVKDGKVSFTAHDVSIMMHEVKIARIASGNVKEDNYVDACGYMACAAEIATKPSEEPPSIMQITAENLARNICIKYDNKCMACPIGLMNNGKAIPCEKFRKAYPQEALQIMRKVGE